MRPAPGPLLPHLSPDPMPRRSALVLALAMLAFTGCASWHARSAPATGDSTTFAHTIRVTRTDRSVLVLEHARVAGDSLVGDVAGNRMSIALRDVARVDERKVSALRTSGLVLGIAVGAFALLLAVAAATLPPSWN